MTSWTIAKKKETKEETKDESADRCLTLDR
jgi:hypothetical protein